VSRQLVTEYQSELDRIHAASGSKRESVVRKAFKDLLKRSGKSRDLIFLAEHEYVPPAGNRCYIDDPLIDTAVGAIRCGVTRACRTCGSTTCGTRRPRS
jgi:hypothetical protein